MNTPTHGLTVVVSGNLNACAAALTADLFGARGAPTWASSLTDPLAPFPIVLGHARMEAWARRRLAHETGVAAGFTFSTLDAALDAAVGLPEAASDDAFTVAALAGRIADVWSEQFDESSLAPVRAYLAPVGPGPAALGTWRGIGLVQLVAERVLEACRERPERVVAWANDPKAGPVPDEHVEPWLAWTMAELELHAAGPAFARTRVLMNGAAPVGAAPIVLLGVDSMRSADRRLLLALAQHVSVRWYRPAALPERWGEASPGPLPSQIAAYHELEENDRAALSGAAAVEVRASSAAAPAPSGPLGVWQATLRGLPTPTLAPATAAQVQGHWTPSREVEALRDELLSRFDAGTLEPRDVVVMTPDLATYGPLIQAIFARRGSVAAAPPAESADEKKPDEKKPEEAAALTAPAIPVSMTQLGLRSTNPLADAVLRLVDLCTDRLTAPALLDVLTIAPVQRALGLAPEDIADVSELLATSGARWGVDAADRLAVYGVAVAQNTVTFGLQRMALGVVMPDEAPEAEFGYGDDDAGREPLAPMATGDRERLRRTARLAATLQRIVSLREDLRRGSRTASEWRDTIKGMVETFTHTGDATRWLVSSLVETLEEVLSASSTPLTLDALRRLLRARFDLPVTSRGNNNSAVLVVPFTPGAIPPCGFLALLGMNTGVFPRATRPLSWEPSPTDAAGQPLAPSATARDRQAFAQAILGTTDDIFISFVAREPRRGEKQPPCVPVDELVEFADRAGARAETFVTQGTRHPWSRARVGPWYDAPILAAANVKPNTGAAAPTVLGPETNRPIEIDADKLATDLLNGPKLMLYGRLGVYLAEESPPAPDREPLDLGVLDDRAISNALLAKLIENGALNGVELDEVEVQAWVAAQIRKFAANGTLPLRAGGARLVAELLEKANEAVKTAREKALPGSSVLAEVPAFTVDLPVGLRVFGRPEVVMQVDGKERLGHLSVSTSSISTRRVLRAWTRLLAAGAMPGGANVAATALVKPGKVEWHLRPTDPAGELNTLAQVWALGRQRLLPLFPECSLAMAKAVAIAQPGEDSPKLRKEALEAVRGAWVTDNFRRGDDQDPYIQRVFPGWQPEDALEGFDQVVTGPLDQAGPLSFRTVAVAVWGPAWSRRKPMAGGRESFTKDEAQ
jgi:exodeoxyribonuclease V gamma subunit